MDNGCDCQECKNKRAYRLEGISIAEASINEKFKKGLYTVGLPRAVIKEALEKAKGEIK